MESTGNESMKERLDVVVAHESGETRDKLLNVIQSLQYNLVAACDSTAELLAACHPTPPDLIMSGIELTDGRAIDTLIQISEIDPTPAIIITPHDSLLDVEQALKDHVMAYLVEPVDEDQIKPTIYLVCERFRQFEELREENQDLRQALENRKVIERAKGILMSKQELSEQDAYRKLQKLAQSKRTRLVEVAQAVVTAEEIGNL